MENLGIKQWLPGRKMIDAPLPQPQYPPNPCTPHPTHFTDMKQTASARHSDISEESSCLRGKLRKKSNDRVKRREERQGGERRWRQNKIEKGEGCQLGPRGLYNKSQHPWASRFTDLPDFKWLWKPESSQNEVIMMSTSYPKVTGSSLSAW